VAYFTRHQAVKGNPAIQTRSGGAIYYFVSVADKVAFSKNPSRYVPLDFDPDPHPAFSIFAIKNVHYGAKVCCGTF
jgi:YHS domain-containing protein